MEHLNAAEVSSVYGLKMGEYGEAGVSSIMALMTAQQAHGDGDGDGDSMMTRLPAVHSSFSSFHGQANQCQLVSASPTLHRQFLAMEQQHSVTSGPLVKTEGCSDLAIPLEFHRVQAGNCSAEPASQAVAPATDELDAMKAKILGHPQYHCLLEAFINCQKVGSPPEIVARLEAVSKEFENRRNQTSMGLGMDPDLDRFMEAYCQLLLKYQEELTKPYKEATAFFKKIQSQLNSLSKETTIISHPGENDEKTEAGGSSDEEYCSTGEIEYGEVDHHSEDRELKDHLFRKYSGCLSGLRKEFMKKKKKGKLPKDARHKLLDWWNLHYKWPYPSETEKVAMAESTGLDQKQINNWFINQRKRHWKPSEDTQFVVMDGHGPLSSAFFAERHLMTEGSAFRLDC